MRVLRRPGARRLAGRALYPHRVPGANGTAYPYVVLGVGLQGHQGRNPDR